MRQRGSTFYAVGVSICVCINALLLFLLGVALHTLVAFALATVLIAATGCSLLRGIKRSFPDDISYWTTSFFLGLGVSYGLVFVLLHRAVLAGLGIAPRQAVLVSFALLSAFSVLMALRYSKRESPRLPVTLSPRALFVSLAAATVVAALASYGSYNNTSGIEFHSKEWSFEAGPIPNWGTQGDRYHHLERLALAHYTENFPPRRLNHFGTAVVFLSYNLLVDDYDLALVVAAFKFLSVPFYFATCYFAFLLARTIFGLSLRVSTLCAATILTFSPITTYPFIGRPSYLGFFSASGPTYHNVTQLAQLAAGVCGFFLVARAFKDDTKTFFWGCSLVVVSFFLKPVFFILIAPTVFLLAFLHDEPLDRDKLSGYALLAGVPAFWTLYMKSFEIQEMAELSLGFRPFVVYLRYLPTRFPEYLQDRPVVLVVSMILLSFAAFIPGVLGALRRTYLAWRERTCSTLLFLRQRRHIVFQAAVFVLALLVSTVLSGAEGKDANYAWAVPVAYVIMLPLLVYLLAETRSRRMRLFSWGLYGVHVCHGVAYLCYFSYYSALR